MIKDKKKSRIDQKPDRIEGDKIILDGNGQFPKTVIIFESDARREYRLTRTKRGGYLFN